MFDIGAGELLVIAIAAILVIGPKDMPMALRTAGRWIGQLRRMSNHFRSGIDAMIREAEMEKLLKLLDRVEKSKEPVIIKRINLRDVRNKKGMVRANITISTYTMKEQKS